jgi:2-polyprenyl-3-methyl-5-hydroxy-6-metoxy-1,4-benzoquinol methylase
MIPIQSKAELDVFYKLSDPWGYQDNIDDSRRKGELLSALPARKYKRTLDIGCGNGYITFDLPGDYVMGIDYSSAAIDWCLSKLSHSTSPQKYNFHQSSIFDLRTEDIGTFDLILITGVLYPQYIGKAMSSIRLIVDNLLAPGGNLLSCHIDEWVSQRFPYAVIDTTLYKYRQYTHRLEVYQK